MSESEFGGEKGGPVAMLERSILLPTRKFMWA